MHRYLISTLLLLAIGAGVGSAAAVTPHSMVGAAAATATVEWTILSPSPPGPAHTLVFAGGTPGIGPIEHLDCATWDGATLTIYDMTTHPISTSPCVPAVKTIRLTGPGIGVYSLTWPEGSSPFFEHILYPGDGLPVTRGADGGVQVALP